MRNKQPMCMAHIAAFDGYWKVREGEGKKCASQKQYIKKHRGNTKGQEKRVGVEFTRVHFYLYISLSFHSSLFNIYNN